MCHPNPSQHYGPWNQNPASCGCMAQTHCGPCFSTKDEKIGWLEHRLECLRDTAEFVEKRLAKLKDNN